MKKLFSLLLMAMVLVLPFKVNAATTINSNIACTKGSDGLKTCTVVVNADDAGEDSLTITLKEEGGAEIVDIFNADDTDWSVQSKTKNAGVWTVVITGPSVAGEADAFKFSYKESGTKDCRVVIGFADQSVPTPVTPDTTTPNKQTGSTLPYIALGSIVVIATVAYIATRNKAKMYKI